MADRSSPEYNTIKRKLPDILDAISDAPATISQLSVRLFAGDLIPKGVRTEVDNAAIGPYDKANKLVTAVHSNVELQAGAFYTFVDILRQCGLALIATALEEDCRKPITIR